MNKKIKKNEKLKLMQLIDVLNENHKRLISGLLDISSCDFETSIKLYEATVGACLEVLGHKGYVNFSTNSHRNLMLDLCKPISECSDKAVERNFNRRNKKS